MSKPSHPPTSTSIRWFLGAACFLAGAAMMVIEICAFRLLAPIFGNSVYTWTALIGVILVAFSAGGFMGGRLVDRFTHLRLLGWLLAGAAILTYLIPPLHLGFGEHFPALFHQQPCAFTASLKRTRTSGPLRAPSPC